MTAKDYVRCPSSRNVRVLFTTPYPSTSPTGVGSFVRTLQALTRTESGTTIIMEPSGREPAGIANLWLAARSVRGILRRRREFDVVHAQQLHLQSLVAAITGRTLGKGVVLTVHGHQPQPTGVRGRVGLLVERATLRFPHRLIFVAESLRTDYGGKGEVIPNGVPAVEISSERKHRETARRELGLGEEFVLAYVGRVTEDKGILTLLAAFQALRLQVAPRLRLMLVGPMQDRIREAIDRQPGLGTDVTAMGARPDPWRFLAAADLFVLPSRREGLPLSLLEAMASGLPVVATQVGDVPRVVRNQFTGLLVPSDDAAKLAEAIAWIVGHPDEAETMAVNAQNLVRSGFDVGQVWSAYRTVYEEAVRATA